MLTIFKYFSGFVASSSYVVDWQIISKDIIFSDENDNIYTDDEYKNRYKEHYLNDIREDLEWYGSVYSAIKHKFDMDGRDPASVTEALIRIYHLDSFMGV